jgi:transcriptional regulator with XRE-family HTH domain
MNAYLEYGSTVQLKSSSAILSFAHEEPVLYSFGMEESQKFGFGARLKDARIAAKLSGAELGKNAGERGKDASKQSVADWEAERHYPKADQLRVICLRLGVSSDHLIFGDLQRQAAMANAENAVSALTAEQRKALLERMLGPAVSDELVEQKMPATKRKAKAK